MSNRRKCKMTREQLDELNRDWLAASLMTDMLMARAEPEPPRIDFKDVVVPETIGWLDEE